MTAGQGQGRYRNVVNNMSKTTTFSIVTPSHNSGRFISETMESVIKQEGDFSIEYIIVDNCSTDDTRDIVFDYKKSVESGLMPINCNEVRLDITNEADTGMYDAINRGFAKSSGDIHAWINADDIYLPGAFDAVQRVFSKYPEILWLKGITSYINENSELYEQGICYLYQQELIEKGLYGPVLDFVQQDSVFWRSVLWHESGGIEHHYQLAGDYFLWRKFAGITPLYSLKIAVSCFRRVTGQKSEDMEEYWSEVAEFGLLKRKKFSMERAFFSYANYFAPAIRDLLYKMIFGVHEYYLVKMDNSDQPELFQGSYYQLNKNL